MIDEIDGIETKGWCEYYHTYEDMMKGENCLGRGYNRFTDAGKAFAVDFLFGNGNWLVDGDWNATRYMRVGTSTNTNQGVIGPSGANGVSISGAWGGVSANDFRLTDDLTSGIAIPSLVNILRATKVAHMFGMITDNEVGAVDVDIAEMGIFLGPDLPLNDPVQYPTEVNRENAMIVRAVNYYQENGEWKVRYIHRAAGESLYIKYAFVFFEG